MSADQIDREECFFFVVDPDNHIESGFEFVEDAQDRVKVLDQKTHWRVVARKGLKRLGVDLEDDEQWRPRGVVRWSPSITEEAYDEDDEAAYDEDEEAALPSPPPQRLPPLPRPSARSRVFVVLAVREHRDELPRIFTDGLAVDAEDADEARATAGKLYQVDPEMLDVRVGW